MNLEPRNGDMCNAFRDAVQECMEKNERLEIMPGDFFVNRQGADTDAIKVDITGNLNVLQSTKANIILGDVDGEFLRLEGNPRDVGKYRFNWTNLRVDQTRQRNSTVMPFDVAYPRQNVGESRTCDALSIRARGVFKSIRIKNARGFAGEHWQNGGGDSMFFIQDCDDVLVENCEGQGHGDLFAYLSRCIATTRGNRAINCFGGINMKRSGTLRSYNDTFVNCPRATACDITGKEDAGDFDVIVRGLTTINCGISGRFTNAKRAWVDGDQNYIIRPGAKLIDGSPETKGGDGGIVFRNCDSTRDNCEVIQ